VGLVALVGVVVTAQVSATVPVNELDGVTVMVEVLVEPGLTVMLPLLVRAKLELLEESQKPAQPVRSGTTASSSFAHVPIFIPAPLSPRKSVPAGHCSS
jgi:hypothetical protein